MAKEDGQGSQLNLTVVALVALVAIVGLVALVLNTASLAKGAASVSADPLSAADANAVGQLLGVNCGAFSANQLEAMADSNSAVLQRVFHACA